MKRASPAATWMLASIAVFGLSMAAGSAEQTVTAQSTSKMESILGREVSTLREGDGGRIIDILVDRDGQLRAAVVEFGGFLGIGTRKIAVDRSAFRFEGPSIMVDVSRAQLRAAPEYKPNELPFVVRAAAE